MKAILLTILLFSSPMAACQSVRLPTAEQAQLAPAQALYVAEVAYSGFTVAAEAALAANPSPATATKIKAVDAQAYAALQQARLGKGTVDAVLLAVGSAQPLLGAK